MTSTDDKLDAILAAVTSLSERVDALEQPRPVAAEGDYDEELVRAYANDPDSVCAHCRYFPYALGEPCPRCGNRAARGPQAEPPMGDVTVTTGPDGGPIFEFPEPTPERAVRRRGFERDLLNIAGALGDESQDWTELYAKGGPFWLYQHNRDLVITYPPATRRAMVQDVAQDSPKLAYEMGRDILKEACGEPDLETGFGALHTSNLTTDKVGGR